MKRVKNFAAGFAVCAAVAGAAYWFSISGSAGPEIGKPAPEFRWTDLSGQTASLSYYRGRVVLLDFWATWCPTCVEERPALIQLYDKYHSQGLELLAPALDDNGRQALVPYLSAHPVPWKVLLSDSEDARLYQVYELPKKVLVDRRGVIAKTYIGPVPPQALERDVRQLISQEAS